MNARRVATWILVVLLAAEFVAAGLSKLVPASAWTGMFLRWGFPPWAKPLVAIIEIVGAVCLLLPRARILACAVLLALMAGAAATHLTHGEPERVLLNIVLAAMLAALIALEVMLRNAPRTDAPPA